MTSEKEDREVKFVNRSLINVPNLAQGIPADE